jgi:hypothetical protein
VSPDLRAVLLGRSAEFSLKWTNRAWGRTREFGGSISLACLKNIQPGFLTFHVVEQSQYRSMLWNVNNNQYRLENAVTGNSDCEGWKWADECDGY